jgi:hypothetical protein
MDVPSFLLPRPTFDLTPEQQAAFERLFQSTPAGEFVDYHLPYPKWQYLSYLCETKELVLHGSQNLKIDERELARLTVVAGPRECPYLNRPRPHFPYSAMIWRWTLIFFRKVRRSFSSEMAACSCSIS